MRRIHAFELEDQSWMPTVLREAGMAYLRFMGARLKTEERLRPLIEGALSRSGEREILDLCSGGGGPMLDLAEALTADGCGVPITLTDRYPDPSAIGLVEASGVPGLRYETESVDAMDVTGDRKGLRTLFNAFHHLKPDQAQGVLASAVAGRRPIAVFEILRRKPLAVLGMLGVPLAVLLLVPFLRPFRLAWIPLTYLIPAIPLFILWDGLVSCFRIYNEEELMSMARAADPDGRLAWEVHDIPVPAQSFPGIALIGIPR
jgi:hypothetical protein